MCIVHAAKTLSCPYAVFSTIKYNFLFFSQIKSAYQLHAIWKNKTIWNPPSVRNFTCFDELIRHIWNVIDDIGLKEIRSTETIPIYAKRPKCIETRNQHEIQTAVCATNFNFILNMKKKIGLKRSYCKHFTYDRCFAVAPKKKTSVIFIVCVYRKAFGIEKKTISHTLVLAFFVNSGIREQSAHTAATRHPPLTK